MTTDFNISPDDRERLLQVGQSLGIFGDPYDWMRDECTTVIAECTRIAIEADAKADEIQAELNRRRRSNLRLVTE
ncbi:hypothetical protein [Jatrophihabitans sp.]|uniref:hypothetical protein n=1 Tax=Jatrophihabitans sp. TaxID=1932789 RepID=UPI0030C6B625|nr:hypothetical protein [Jatrophihabitans sp.]